MRDSGEIAAMRERLEDNINEHGWEPTIDGAATALSWVLGSLPLDLDAYLRTSMERPSADRRREWIARGGNPDHWTLKVQPLPADTSTTSTEDASAGASTQEAP